MRATTLLNSALGIKSTRVVGVQILNQTVVCEVRPKTRIPRCGGCGCRVRKGYDRRPARLWRHLDTNGMLTHLQYAPRRVACPRCGPTTEMVPWAEPGSWFTYAFEQTVGYLAQMSAKTVVSTMMRVSWQTVGKIVERLVKRLLPKDKLEGLRQIGVDELSYRKHHKYITIVTNHEDGRVVWMHEGKSAETFHKFFDELGDERSRKLDHITMDMSQAYISAVKTRAPRAQIVFDRFHVQKLVQEALDEVRRSEVREADTAEAKNGLKRTRFALLKNPWNLKPLETGRLNDLVKVNERLYMAYLQKESFSAILQRRQAGAVRRKLAEWKCWVDETGLRPFVKVARTIESHLEGIIGYIKTGLSNGRVEGINGKARTITRRSYGLHSAGALMGMIWLCCSRLELQPAHVKSRTHQT